MHSKSTTYLTAKEYEFDVKLPTGFYAVRDVNSETSVKMDRFNSDEKMQVLDHEDDASSKESSQGDVPSETEDLNKENVNQKKKAVSKITITSRKRPSTNETSENLSLNKSISPEKKSTPPAKRNKTNGKAQESADSTPSGRRSTRNKKTTHVESDGELEKKEESEQDEEELAVEEDGQEAEEEEATIGSMSSKKASPKKSKVSVKKVDVKKTVEQKSPDQVKNLPVRAST